MRVTLPRRSWRTSACCARGGDNGIGIPGGGRACSDRFYRVDKMRSRAARHGPWTFHRGGHRAPPRRQHRRQRPREAAAPASRCGSPPCGGRGRHEEEKAFLFTFLVLSLLLAACVRGGGTEGENSYTIYYPAAELRDVPGEGRHRCPHRASSDATLTQEELAQRCCGERLLADAPDAGRPRADTGQDALTVGLGCWARVDFSRGDNAPCGQLVGARRLLAARSRSASGHDIHHLGRAGAAVPQTQTAYGGGSLLSMRGRLYHSASSRASRRRCAQEKRALALSDARERAAGGALGAGPESDARSQRCCRRSSPCSPPAWRRTCYSICPPTPISASRRGRRWSRWKPALLARTVEHHRRDGEIAAQLNGVNVGSR